MKTPILKINNLVKVYATNGHTVRAVDGISLELFAGEIFGLLGVNGAGKTTLSSILTTLHPPTSGDVLYKNQSIYQNILQYRKALGFCPQTQNLDMFLTVEENLIFAGRYFLMPEDQIRQRVKELMEQLDLTRYANFDIDKLSGGTKQRVLIARALVHKPEILILDEPTVGLDPDIRKRLWQLIRDLKALGITIILTTHYLEEAEALSDRICILHEGKVSLLASMKDLREEHKKARLEDIFLQLLEEDRKKI